MWKVILGVWLSIGLLNLIFSGGSSTNGSSGSQARDDSYSLNKVVGANGTSIKTDVGNLNAHESKSSIDGYNGIKD